MTGSIPVIDLFAGPGGLGEGFSSCRDSSGVSQFHICLSIEKDEVAHQTLLLRAFFRQFPFNSVPPSYYQYLKKEIDIKSLFRQHREEARMARREAWLATLGEEKPNAVKRRIKLALSKQSKKAWVLIGGPPCQAYSIAGRARKTEIRKNNLEEYEKDERHYLYREYLRIIADHQPPVFIMENVKGILSSTISGKKIFHQILEDLRQPRAAINSYNKELYRRKKKRPAYNIFPLVKKQDYLAGFEPYDPSDYIIAAERFGVPQARHRVILLGIRADLMVKPKHLEPKPFVTVKEVISNLPKLRSAVSKEADSESSWITTLQEAIGSDWLERSIKTKDKRLWSEVVSTVKHISTQSLNTGFEYVEGELCLECYPGSLRDWYHDNLLDGVCNHSARSHMKSDLHRYLFASCYAKITGRSPELRDFPENLLPDHENVKDALKGSFFSDRFRVQLPNKPALTVTSHISKDGHYYIHPDPTQCRSMTVREAARLQTFPDNYFFEGPRTAQYHQVGNAVPPLLARQIAAVVYDIFQQSDLV
ncbi:MAG: (cytosine-5)-methyltransferase 1 [Pyrinomonadaceae bacterium]|jgi:DNA (cytosine-5)-methyltransferase 1|nr:(cytosine-5)-methyltransferase 1 [Pyrinomonadaceae bacterium]